MIGTGKTTGIVLDVARQRGGATPSVVTLHDHSRFSNDGAMTNVTWVQLPSGLWVMNFNGATSFINCGTSQSLEISGAITILAWVRPDNVAGSKTIIDKRSGGVTEGYELRLNTDKLDMLLIEAGPATRQVTSASLVSTAWQMIAGVADSALMTLYINGVLDANTLAWSGYMATGPVSLGIGKKVVAGGNPFAGLIALPRVHNYAYSAAQIYAHFQAERGFFGV